MRFSTVLCLSGLLALPLVGKAQTAPAWQWANALTSTSGLYINNAVVDASGDTYLLVEFNAPLTLEPGTTLTSTASQFYDGVVASFSKSGTLRWARQFKSPNGLSVRGLAVDRTGNAFVAGSYTQSLQVGNITATAPAGTGQHAFVVKLDNQGQPAWLRENSGVGTATGYDVRVDSQDNLYLTGTMKGTVSFGSETLTNGDGTRASVERDIYLVKYTSQGTVAWARQGGRTLDSRAYYHRVSVSPGDEAYLTCALDNAAGSFGSRPMPAGRGSYDGVIVKYSSQGSTEWVQRVGGAGLDLTLGGLGFDAAGRVGVGVRYEGTATVGTQTLTGSGIRTGALVVLDATTGTPVWTRSIMGSNFSDCGDVVADNQGNFYLSGFFDGTATIGTTTLTSSGGADALVARFTPQGSLSWVQKSTGAGNEFAGWLGIDNSNEVAVCGRFDGTVTFGTQQLTSQANPSVFVARLGSTITSTRPASLSAFTPYPNPVKASSQLHLPQLPAQSMVSLLDAQGRLICQISPAVAGTAQMSLANCPAGTYYVRVVTPQAQPTINRILVIP